MKPCPEQQEGRGRPGGARGRAGLTLLEMLAASTLLASVAVACAGLLGALARSEERRQVERSGSGQAWAEVLARELVADWTQFGLAGLGELSGEPQALGVGDALLERMNGAGRVPSSELFPHVEEPGCPRLVLARSVPAAVPERSDRRGVGGRVRPRRTVELRWLIVEVDGGYAVRLVEVAAERAS